MRRGAGNVAEIDSALDALGVDPHETLYVGDGSDQELTGAARCGMTAVLVSRDLSNTYDDERADVVGWGGPVIRDLSELRGIVDGEIVLS